MKSETREWINKAEGDLGTARREMKVTLDPNFDAACFHAQQCAEKYLKARLIEADLGFPKIHDLDALLDLVIPIEPSYEDLREDLQHLTDMAVEVRYPGVSADSDDASEAVSAARRIRTLIRNSFGLEVFY
jgi:HEPN domain-containing protein